MAWPLTVTVLGLSADEQCAAASTRVKLLHMISQPPTPTLSPPPQPAVLSEGFTHTLPPYQGLTSLAATHLAAFTQKNVFTLHKYD